MPRWYFPLLLALVLTASPAAAQFGGIQFPGMGGRRNPRGQQGPNDSPHTNNVYGPTETLTGSLRQISSSSLVLDAGDDRIILVQIQKGTKYESTMGKVKPADFEPGDHVTIDATRDDNDHYYSKTITMNMKGTAAEKAAATRAAGGGSSPGSESTAGATPDDNDPDRPILRRSTPDSAAAQPTAASSDSPGSAASRPSVASQPAPAPSSPSDDSGPPVLRRSSTPSAPAAPEVASSESPSARPSLSAEDVNGVTRVPVAPPPPSAGAAPDRIGPSSMPISTGDGDPVIDKARDAAFSFTETLPNYVVKRLTNRYASASAARGSTSWQPLDIVTTDLIYEDGKERYTNVMVNGKATNSIEQSGSWSEGEFGSMLQAILSPATAADFHGQRSVTIINRPAFRYDYSVQQPRSTWTLHTDGQVINPSYTGSIWIDKATYRVLRIEIAATNLPRSYPLDTAESSIDYDFVMIGDRKVLLPVQSDSLTCTRGTSDCSKNHTEYHNYRKFTADTSITFEGADQ